MSTTPRWKDAPSWANWLTCDVDGWWWFEKEPVLHDVDGTYVCPIFGGRATSASYDNLLDKPFKEERYAWEADF